MSATYNGVVAVVWEARAKAGKTEEVRDLLRQIVTPSRNDPGNIDYEVHEDEARPGTFVAYERWVSASALEAHTRSSWIPALIPRLLELIDGAIEDELRILHPFRPGQ